VTSIDRGAGKTMICAGLGRQLRKAGRKAGFFKPIITTGNQVKAGSDSDTVFMKSILDLPESVEVLNPVFSRDSNLSDRIKQAYLEVARDKDIVLIEGPPDAESENIIQALDARTLIIDGYSARLSPKNYLKPGMNLLGVIINKVAVRHFAWVSGELMSGFRNAGVTLLGVIPEDRVLSAITVADLAQSLGGKVLNAADRTNELVESVMIGAMTVDSGLDYFGRRNNKAVLVRGERPDMQMAALQTATRCLVIGGGGEPVPAVLQQAELRQVPLISVKSDTAATVVALEGALLGARFNQEKKLARLDEIMGKHFKFPELHQALGLSK